MKFEITYDANSEAKLDEILKAKNTLGFDEYFSTKDYDDSGIELFIVLMCRDSNLNFRQRIRFSKKENCLYMDIMLDLTLMKNANATIRKRIVAEKLVSEVPRIIVKYKFKDFDLQRFSSDLEGWFVRHGWIGDESSKMLLR